MSETGGPNGPDQSTIRVAVQQSARRRGAITLGRRADRSTSSWRSRKRSRRWNTRTGWSHKKCLPRCTTGEPRKFAELVNVFGVPRRWRWRSPRRARRSAGGHTCRMSGSTAGRNLPRQPDGKLLERGRRALGHCRRDRLAGAEPSRARSEVPLVRRKRRRGRLLIDPEREDSCASAPMVAASSCAATTGSTWRPCCPLRPHARAGLFAALYPD